jgi:hypothetical protein
MAALTNSTYGKATTMPAAVLTNFADAMTAALQSGIAAVNDLNDDIATGAPVNQATVNTLLKFMQDMGELATEARKAAMDEVAPATPEPVTGGTDADSGSTTAAPDSGSTTATGTGSSASAKTGAGTSAKS